MFKRYSVYTPLAIFVAVLTVVASAILPMAQPSQAAPSVSAAVDQDQAVSAYLALPLYFEANIGQVNAAAQFVSRGSGYTLFLTADGAVFSLRQAADPPAEASYQPLQMKVAGSSSAVIPVAESPLPGISNYFIGNDPAHWYTGIPHYAQVRYPDIYPGIDLVYSGDQQQLQYNFEIAPGASPEQIRLQFDPVERLEFDQNGDLLLHLSGGVVRQKAPYTYQNINGTPVEVSSRFVLLENGQVGFEVGSYDPALPLIIDPTLQYSTFLGGSATDEGDSIYVDGTGAAYVTGFTQSGDFPVGVGSLGGAQDAFVTKLNPAGNTLAYSTYLGGASNDEGKDIFVDGAGNAYITGYTQSVDFPTQSPLYGSSGGLRDAFVAELNPAGAALVYSTYLGGSSNDEGRSIVVDGTGMYVTGYTESNNFPTAAAYDATLGGTRDAFVTKFNPAGAALLYSTYLGGSSNDQGNGIAIDATGNAYLTGYTESNDFPTVTAYDATLGGTRDVFVTKLDNVGGLGGVVTYSTYLGGTGVDEGMGIAVNGSEAFVTGYTSSSLFPLQGAYDSALNGTQDAFVTRFNATGNGLVYSTYLGGDNSDQGNSIAVDTYSNAYVTGSTSSDNFPQRNNTAPLVRGGGEDAFVTKLDTTVTGAASLADSVYLGGLTADRGNGIAVDSNGAIYVTGTTGSNNFPVLNYYDNLLGGFSDAFVSKLIIPKEILITRTGGAVNVTEATPILPADQDTYVVTLSSKPSGNVVIDLSTGTQVQFDTGSGFGTTGSVTLTSANWSTGVTVTVQAVDDSIIEGPHTSTIIHTINAALTTDNTYDTATYRVDGGASSPNPYSLQINIADNDTPGITVNPTALSVSEPTGTGTFTLRLTSTPTADVTIGLSSSDINICTVAPASVVLNSGNWNVPQSVTVTAVDDTLINIPNRTCTIITAPAVSTDTNYNNLNAVDVTVTVIDNDSAGIIVSPLAINVSEPNNTGTFNIRLGSSPLGGASVTVPLSSSAPANCTVPVNVVIPAASWSTGVNVTVTAVDDHVINHPARTCTVITGSSASSDPSYNNINPDDVSVTINDDDVPGINIAPLTLTVSEPNSTATFTVTLASIPTGDVHIPLSTSNTQCAVSGTEVVVTPAQWLIGVPVTVTAVDDPDVDGSQTCIVITGDPTSTDTDYNNPALNPANVTVTVQDDDVAGITVSPTTLTVTEPNVSATFGIHLNTRPTADVTITLSSSANCTINPLSVTFTNTDWNVIQNITVTPVDDDQVNNPLRTCTITTNAATSGDGNYNGLDPADVSVTINDNDVAGFIVTPTALSVVETVTPPQPASTATFTVRLTSQPSASVTLSLTSSDVNACTVAPASLTFTTAPGSWSTPQTVTVTSVDDLIVNSPPRTCTILTGPDIATSDTDYNGLDPVDVTVTVNDNEQAGVTINPLTLTLTEATPAVPGSFTVRLNTQPDANVDIVLSTSNGACTITSSTTLTFTSGNWNTPQTVTVEAVDNLIIEPSPHDCIVLTAAIVSGDTTGYNGLNPSDVTVHVMDNDTPSVIVTGSPLTIAEPNTTGTFHVSLGTQPSAAVTVALSSSAPTVCTVPASVTIPAGSWSTGVDVTVTPVDDFIINVPPRTCVVITGNTTSSDPNYNNLPGSGIANVDVTVTDNDTAGVTVSPTSLTVYEPNSTASFNIRLTSTPSADVVVNVSSSDPTVCTVNPTTVTVAPASWNTGVNVTVTAVDDSIINPAPRTCTIITSNTTSTDSNYNNLPVNDVAVTVNDNDTAGYVVSPLTLSVNEPAGSGTFNIHLTSQPSAGLTIPLSIGGTDPGACSINPPASVTIAPVDWNTGATVTVTAVDDSIINNPLRTCTIVTSPDTTTSDTNYNGLDPADVAVTVNDNDVAQVTVVPTTLTVAEPNGTATFTITLGSIPTSPVTILMSSSDTSECTVPESATLDNTNWNTGVIVTVSAVDDFIIDGTQPCTVITGNAISGDTDYNGVTVDNVNVSVTDNDAPALILNTTSITVTEPNGTSPFIIRLATQPTGDVTVPLRSSDTTACTVPSSVTIPPASWATGVTVTVTAVDDSIINTPPGRACTVVSDGPSSSTDTNYTGLTIATVNVLVQDNETAAIVVNPTSLVVFEPNSSNNFNIHLTSQPTGPGNVVIGLSANATICSLSTTSVTLTSANWQAGQNVTVTAVDDAIVNPGDRICTVTTTNQAVSGDPNYDPLPVDDVTVTVIDDETANIIVDPTSLTLSEPTGSANFTIRLTTLPTSSVTISTTSSAPGNCTVSTGSVVLDNTNWNTGVAVTVTAVDDQIYNGAPRTCTVQTGLASSLDPSYSGINPADVNVTILDNDVASYVVTPTLLNLGEPAAGPTGSGTFNIHLTSRPTADITITAASSNTSVCTVSPNVPTVLLVNDWQVGLTFTVTVVDDTLVTGTRSCSIVSTVTTPDTVYASLPISDVAVYVADDETADILVSPTSMSLSEPSGSQTFNIRLSSMPTADVLINLVSLDTTECNVSPSSVTLTGGPSGNWQAGLTATVSVVDDLIADGTQTCIVQTQTASSGDPNYNGQNPPDVNVSVADNDASGIVVSPTSLNVSESGTTANFNIHLLSQPTANVTIGLTSLDTTECTVGVPSVVLNASNWQVGVNVTVTGVDDFIVDGPQNCVVETAAAVSTDPAYNNAAVSDVLVTVADNDTASILVSPTALTVSESGTTDTFNVRLSSQPTADVTIPLTISDPTECEVTSPVTLNVVLTSTTWQAGVIVTVRGRADGIVDGTQTCTVQTGAAITTDPLYSGLNPADVNVTVLDIDTARIIVNPTTLTVNEAGTTATFNISLNTAPTGNVSIAMTVSDPTECLESPTSVTLTAGNWSTGVNVTVTGQPDGIVDGNQLCIVQTAGASSPDARFNGIDPDDVQVTVIDNDAANIVVDPLSLTIDEPNGTGDVYIRLSTQPTGDVTIPLSIGGTDPTACTIIVPATPPLNAVLTSTNWATGFLVRIEAVDDFIVNTPLRTCMLVTGVASSSDGNYNNHPVDDVNITVNDNEVVGGTDVGVSKTASAPNGQVGDPITFNIVVTNNGPVDASNLEVTDLLPSSLTFNGASATVGTYTAASGLWVVGNLSVGSSATLTINTIINAGATGTNIVNTATISRLDQTDTNAGNNTSSATVRVGGALIVTKQGYDLSPSTPLQSGDTVGWVICAQNSNASAVSNVNITDTLDTTHQTIPTVVYFGVLATCPSSAPVAGLTAQTNPPGNPNLSVTIPSLPSGQVGVLYFETTMGGIVYSVPSDNSPVSHVAFAFTGLLAVGLLLRRPLRRWHLPLIVMLVVGAMLFVPAARLYAQDGGGDVPTEPPLPFTESTATPSPEATEPPPTEVVPTEVVTEAAIPTEVAPEEVAPTPIPESWTHIEVNDTSVELQGVWQQVEASWASEGTYFYSEEPTAALLLSFEGKAFRLSYVVGPNFGSFEVYVDDLLITTFDGYSAESALQTSTDFVLMPGSHLLRIQNTDQKSPDSQGNLIGLDVLEYQNLTGEEPTPVPAETAPATEVTPTEEATEVTPTETAPATEVMPPVEGWTRVEATDTTVELQGVWEMADAPFASEGTYLYTEEAGAALSFNFEGQAFRLSYVVGPFFGIFDVYFDDQLATTLDSYSAESALQTVEFALMPGQHRLRLQNTGNSNAEAQGTYVGIDTLEYASQAVEPTAIATEPEIPPAETEIPPAETEISPAETEVPPTETETPTPEPTQVPTPVVLEDGWTRYEISPALVQLQGTWDQIDSPFVSDGSYLYTEDPTASLEFDFQGEKIRLDYLLYWNFGVFDLYIDDQLIATIDSYSAESDLKTTSEFALVPGTHRLRIQNTDRANAESQGYLIGLDVFDIWQGELILPTEAATEAATEVATEAATEAPTPPTAEPSPTPAGGPVVLGDGWVRYEVIPDWVELQGNWTSVESPAASDGSYAYAEEADASVTFEFSGEGIRLNYLQGPNFGTFEISIDEQLAATVDGYSAEDQVATSGEFQLIPGDHILLIRNTGQANEASSGTAIALDTIDVLQKESILTPTAQALLPVAGTVWFDTDGDSAVSPSDQPAAGQTLNFYLDNGDVVFDAATDALSTTVVTDEVGAYFIELPEGIYWLEVAVPNWEPLLIMAPSTTDVLIPQEVSEGVTLEGRVFNDNNANREWSGDIESGIRGVQVYLYLDNGDQLFDPGTDSQLGQVLVNDDGTYDFTGLHPGTYWLWVDESTLPPNYMDTVETGNHGIQNPSMMIIQTNEGSTPTPEATEAPAPEPTEEVAAEPPQEVVVAAVPAAVSEETPPMVEGPDFAYALDSDHDTSPDSIEGVGDRNNNGIPNYLDPYDPSGTVYIGATGNAVSGVQVRLVYGGGVLADTVQVNPQTTSASGSYRFDIVVGTVNGVPNTGTRQFTIELVPPLPTGYTYPSVAYPANAGVFDGNSTPGSGQIVPFSYPPNPSQSHLFYMEFLVQAGDDPIANNHIAVDANASGSAAVINNTACATYTGSTAPDCGSGSLNLNSSQNMTFVPNNASDQPPGQTATYGHTLTNVGTQSDSYLINFPPGTRGWSQQLQILSGGSTIATLTAGQTATVGPVAAGGVLTFVHTITVPMGAATGLVDTSIITATSQSAPGLVRTVTDVTTVVTGGCIDGRVYNDLNRNQLYDTGEPVYSGARVIIRNSSGAVVNTRTTDINGMYNIQGLPAGNYTLEIDPTSIAGVVNFTPGSLTRTVAVAIGATCANGSFGLIMRDPAITKAGSVTQAAPGDTITFTITVTNPYSTAMTNVVVTDPLNAQYEYVSATTTQGLTTFNTSTHAVEFTLGTVNAGATVTMTVVVRVAASTAVGTTIDNVGRLRFAESPNEVVSAAATVTISGTSAGTATPTGTVTVTPIGATGTGTGTSAFGTGGPEVLPATGYRPKIVITLPTITSRWQLAALSALEMALLALALVTLLTCAGWGVAQWLAETRSRRLARWFPTRPSRRTIMTVITLALVSSLVAGGILVGNLSHKQVKSPEKEQTQQTNPAQPTEPVAVGGLPSEQPGSSAQLPITWDEKQVELEEQGSRSFALPEIPAERLIIPRLGIDTKLVNAPVKGDTWDVSGFHDEIAHLDGTAYAGTVGNAVFAGHIYHQYGMGPFRNLDQLRPGDLIIAEGKGVEYTYIVSSTEVVGPNDMEAVAPSNQPLITLISCAGWEDETWSYRSRLVVRAKFNSWRKTDSNLLNAPSKGAWTRYEVDRTDTELKGKWEEIASDYTSNGSFFFSEDKKAVVTLKFTGEKIRLHYLDYWNFGTFEVYVDGEKIATIDSYNPQSRIEGSDIYFVEPGEHVLVIKSTGQKNPDSQGTYIALDAIDIYAANPQ